MTYELDSTDKLLGVALQQANLNDMRSVTHFWEAPIDFSSLRQEYLCFREAASKATSVILYHSMWGDRVSDNPLAILDYLLSHPEHGTYLHVWAVRKNTRIPAKYKHNPNVVFVRVDTLAYAFFLATAGFIITNVGLPEYFMRRPDQKFLNTWHGTPYKALGRDASGVRFGLPSGVRSFLKATHVISTSTFMTDALFSAYSLTGTATARVAETGYPRVDVTLNTDRELQAKLHQTLGLVTPNVDDTASPVVLYAPTWRSHDAHDHVDIDHLVKDLEALASLDIQLIYRGHHRIGRMIQDQLVGNQVAKVIVPPDELSSNEILSVVDILVTDYSSIFFDFLGTGRPIVHYLYDLDEYRWQRGLNLEISELPGDIALNRNELSASVKSLTERLASTSQAVGLGHHPLQGTSYERARERFAPHDDGFATQRVVDFFISGKVDKSTLRDTKDRRPTLAFWAGRLKGNSEDRIFLQRVMKYATSDKHQTTLVIDHKSEIDDDILNAIAALKSRLSTITYERRPPLLLPSEKAAHERFTAQRSKDFESINSMIQGDLHLQEIFTRECKRRLGDATFDRILIAPGVSIHELAMAATAAQFDLLKSRVLLDVRVAALQDALKQIRNSTSWKVTAPLRTMINSFRGASAHRK